MQYWIFYQAGVGGDGFGNLLEHATNVLPADGFLEWRVHPYDDLSQSSDLPVRFFQPKWAQDPVPFRYPTLAQVTELNHNYVKLVAQGNNTVVTAHYNYYYDLIDQFEYKSIVEQDQVRIHLYSDRCQRVYQDLSVKRGQPAIDQKTFEQQHQFNNQIELARSWYHIHIDIEQAWRSWDYMQDCMSQLSIDLPRAAYDHYLTYINNLKQ